MVEVRIEQKPAFVASGRKTWISGQDNERFGTFWEAAHRDGLVDRLKLLSADPVTNVTGSRVFGISCVGADPANRAFDFFIASECGPADDLETVRIPACTWAIFSNRGTLPMSLIEAEMTAFAKWLPASDYRHAHAPELEVFPDRDDSLVEFWLPVERVV